MMRFFLFLLIQVQIFGQSYRLYCYYTPEYKTLYENYFLPSLKDDFEIIVKEYPQECPSAFFRSAGWDMTMLHKLELLKHAILDNWNQIFFYSDIDIIFLRSIVKTCLEYLAHNDFVVQQSWPRDALCAGFFVIRGNEKTLRLINDAAELLQNKKAVDDQLALQAALKKFQPGEIAWQLLPSEQFPNGRRVMNKNDTITLDPSIILFHASCTQGLNNKYRFLSLVEQEYLKMQSLR